jgi:hypothetical protein
VCAARPFHIAQTSEWHVQFWIAGQRALKSHCFASAMEDGRPPLHSIFSCILLRLRFARSTVASLDALEHQTRLVRGERRHDVIFFEITSEFLVPWISRQKAERRAKAARELSERLASAQRLKWIVAASVLLVIAAAAIVAAL